MGSRRRAQKQAAVSKAPRCSSQQSTHQRWLGLGAAVVDEEDQQAPRIRERRHSTDRAHQSQPIIGYKLGRGAHDECGIAHCDSSEEDAHVIRVPADFALKLDDRAAIQVRGAVLTQHDIKALLWRREQVGLVVVLGSGDNGDNG
jgi:hypothetical protein